MAWTSPMTWVTGQTITANQLNANIRDNLLETAVAKATTSGSHFASTGVNTLAERLSTAAYIGTSETTTATSFADLTTVGPSVTVASGNRALVFLSCAMSNNTANANTVMGVDTSGSYVLPASGVTALVHISATAGAQLHASFATLFSVTPGTSTFTAKYQVSTGTGTFAFRRITVVPF